MTTQRRSFTLPQRTIVIEGHTTIQALTFSKAQPTRRQALTAAPATSKA